MRLIALIILIPNLPFIAVFATYIAWTISRENDMTTLMQISEGWYDDDIEQLCERVYPLILIVFIAVVFYAQLLFLILT